MLWNLFLLNTYLKGYLKGQATVTRKAIIASVILLYRLSGLYICKKMLHTAHTLPPISPEQLAPSVCSTGSLVIGGNKADSRGWCLQRENSYQLMLQTAAAASSDSPAPTQRPCLNPFHMQQTGHVHPWGSLPPLYRETAGHGYEKVLTPLIPTRTEVRDLCGGGEGAESLQYE